MWHRERIQDGHFDIVSKLRRISSYLVNITVFDFNGHVFLGVTCKLVVDYLKCGITTKVLYESTYV